MQRYSLSRKQIESIVHFTRNSELPELFDLFTKVLSDQTFSRSVHLDCLKYFQQYAETDKDMVCRTLLRVALLPKIDRDLVILIMRLLAYITHDQKFIMETINEMPTDRSIYVNKELSTPL